MCKLTDIEIDILVRKNEALKDEVCELRTENERLQAENARLKKESIERIRELTKVVYDTEFAEAKAEAEKEFAKFLIDKIDGGLISYSLDIPNLVVDFLEMTEKE